MVEREINEEEVIKAQAKKSSYQLNIILKPFSENDAFHFYDGRHSSIK